MRRLAPVLLVLLSASPARAQVSDEALWVGGAAAVAGAFLLDRTVDEALPDGGGEHLAWATRGLNYGGRPQVALPLLGVVWAGGELGGRPQYARSAERIGAGLLAAGVVSGALKYTLGRERPSRTDDPLQLRPLNPDNRWQAFPSGHATVAFSLATGISAEARSPVVTVLAYSGAGLVAWSRVYDDKHWTSDVVGGAVIGVGMTRVAMRLTRELQEREVPVTVVALQDGVALRIAVP